MQRQTETAGNVEEASKPKKSATKKRIIVALITTIVLLIIIGVVLAVVLTVLNKQKPNIVTDSVDSRVDCLPWLKGKNEIQVGLKEQCQQKAGCKFQSIDGNQNVPSCYYDMDSIRLSILDSQSTSLGFSYTIAPARRQSDNDTIRVDFEYLENHVLRFKIYKPSQQDYEVPIQVSKPVDGIKAKIPDYEVIVNQTNLDNFNFQIKRISTQTIIWDTSLGPIIYENFNRQIATKLPSINVYGFGENKHESFRHDLNYKNWPIFNRDEAPENVREGNLYGTQPFYTCMEPYGKSHGVALLNSNAMDYEFVPSPGLIYRITGGVLDFYVFFGPEPENVIQQFTHYFGRPFMPPYWALGFSISRYGYKDLDDMKQVLQRFQDNQLPLDTQVADIDHFDQRADFTIDPINWADLPAYFDYLHSLDMKTVLILDPAIPIENHWPDYWPYTEGRLNDVFIKWPDVTADYSLTNSTIMVAACWPPGPVAYPDYFKQSTQKWWIDSIMRHHLTLDFDGIWIDMNDPSAFGTNGEKPFNWPENREPWSLKCPDGDYELVKTKASYVHGSYIKLSDKTLCMIGLQGENNEYIHFDVHNLYGHLEMIPTFDAAKQIANGKRGLVYSRSTFLGSGQYGGHWTGDNHSRWSNLYYSIIGMLEFNLFGIPYVGADICGFFENATVELCARWSSLGAFYPFSRNHNGEGNIEQDPGALGPIVVSAAKKALNIRYQLLPYYYTLFYKAHTFGNTVARPLFHEFARDIQTYSIDRQFLIGPALLVTPVLNENATSVDGYFPANNWYDWYNGTLIVTRQDGDENGRRVTLQSPLDHIPVHVRGGFILPTQEAALTTTASRARPFGLVVAPDNYGHAKGDLFYDDGETDLSAASDLTYYATFSLNQNVLKMYVEQNGYADMDSKTLNTIRIFVTASPNSLKFILNTNQFIMSDNIKYERNQITLSNLNLPMTQPFELEWTTEGFIPPGSFGPVIDCAPDNPLISPNECANKNCTFGSINDFTPKCFVPENKGGYLIQTIVSQNEFDLSRADSGLNLVMGDIPIQTIRLTISHGRIDNTFGLTRIKLENRDDPTRYQVPISLNFQTTPTTPYLTVSVTSSPFTNRAQLSVKNSQGMTLFDTAYVEHGLAFYDQFLQIVLALRDYKNLYGFGENTHYSFRHRFAYASWWPMFGRDQPPGGRYINLYGTQPFFMAIDERSGRAFGTLILNSNAQEYGLLPPSSISYRTLGGILDLYVMEEASPEMLIQAYTRLIGKPFMPPYWGLGFQLSRYGYNIIERLQDAVNRTLNAQIPLDIQYADIDHYYKNLDFTYDMDRFRGLPDYIKELRSKGVRFIIILDPAINSELQNYDPYTRGKQMDVFIKWPIDENPQVNEFGDSQNEYMLGYVWPEGKTAFPDFFQTNTQNWWINEIKLHYSNTLTFDGLWIDMNEPANFGTNEDKPWNWPATRPPWNLTCPSNRYDDPPYLPLAARPYGDHRRISDKTLCMRGRQGQGNNVYSHYDVHNMFGWSQSEPTLRALRELLNERSVVISRSTYVSSGTHAGHWLGDNNSSWDHLLFNIIGMLEFNLFGVPYIGADICGYFSNTTSELCTRWMQLGAFNTFFRNHNGFGYIRSTTIWGISETLAIISKIIIYVFYDTKDQDPAALGIDVATASRAAVELRYSLLPYLYTLFYNVHMNGGTVIRSLVHEFPTDERTVDIDRQFMWGSSLLISPVLEPNTRSVYAYFPKSTRWFDFYSGEEVAPSGRAYELDAALDHIPLHIRGGSLIVTQQPAINTEQSRKNPFGLLVAPGNLNTVYKFTLFYDNGNDIDMQLQTSASLIEFSYSYDGVHLLNIAAGVPFNYEFGANNTLNEIKIMGVESRPNSIILNGQTVSTYEYRSASKVLTYE